MRKGRGGRAGNPDRAAQHSPRQSPRPARKAAPKRYDPWTQEARKHRDDPVLGKLMGKPPKIDSRTEDKADFVHSNDREGKAVGNKRPKKNQTAEQKQNARPRQKWSAKPGQKPAPQRDAKPGKKSARKWDGKPVQKSAQKSAQKPGSKPVRRNNGPTGGGQKIFSPRRKGSAPSRAA